MIPTSNEGPSVIGQIVVERYEALRCSALGAPLAPAARVGLALLLGRGMWAWARAAADAPCARQTQSLPATAGVATAASHRLAGLLAELAVANSGRNL